MVDGAIVPSREYWDEFYRNDGDAVPHQPSAFATWALDHFPPGASIIELGFGTARDSLYFATKGHTIRGFDFSATAVTRANRLATSSSVDAKFDLLDLTSPSAAEALKRMVTEPVVIFGRFLMHALPKVGRETVFNVARDVQALLFLEFRTAQDMETGHYFGEDHFREFLETSEVRRAVESRGARVVHALEGRGLAVYKDEDPVVGRIIADFGTFC